MQLRQAEPIRPFDDHHRGIRHIDAYLYHRGRNQDLDVVFRKLLHDLLLFRLLHFAMQKPDGYI